MTMVSQPVKLGCLIQANDVRRLADNMVQLEKEGTLSLARRAAAFVRGDDVLDKLFTELAYRDRDGRYTRLLGTRIRVGDAEELYPMLSVVSLSYNNIFFQKEVVLIRTFQNLSFRQLLSGHMRVTFGFIDIENLLRQSKPPTPQPPQRTPLDPRTKSKLSAQFTLPKEERISGGEDTP